MNERIHDRLFAASGIASVALMLAGVVIGSTGGRQFVTVTSSPSDIAEAIAKPVGTAAWTGAYLELLSFGCFLAFAVWACAKLGGGLLGQIALAAATSYVTVSVASLAVMDTLAYRSGHGIGLQLATALVTLNQAFYVVTWFLSAFFLLAAGPLALQAGRRAIGWSAIAVAAIVLVLTPLSLDNLAQLANFLWLIWIVAASVVLGARRGAPVGAVAPARS
ncbi:MAG: hypothetical protein ACJ757_06020 [Gaiellaceae bacterium]